MAFHPRTAIVTGSESGIGRATALALAEAGMDIGITWHRSVADAEETARAVRRLGRGAWVAALDASDPDCGEVIDGLIQELGGIDVFVNNAGTGGSSLLLDTPWAEWRHVMAVDLDGPFLLLQRAARAMVAAQRGGRLIAVTSVHEHQAGHGAGVYDAAKHGLGGLMKTFALELGRYGITANCVAPGEIATAMNGLDGADVNRIERPGIPLGRPGDPREVAAAIAYLASESAGYITGTSLVVDGGMLQMGPQAGSAVTTNAWRAR